MWGAGGAQLGMEGGASRILAGGKARWVRWWGAATPQVLWRGRKTGALAGKDNGRLGGEGRHVLGRGKATLSSDDRGGDLNGGG